LASAVAATSAINDGSASSSDSEIDNPHFMARDRSDPGR
jgi:hypothetical protein